MTTHNTLRTCGYTGEYYIVIDNQDDQAERYRSLYGDSRVIVFDKNAIGKVTDAGDNFDGMTAILWARNAVFDIARRLGFTYFQMLDDDFSGFLLKYMNKERTKIWNKPFKRYDDWVDIAINFLDDTGAVSVASAQGGDWIGGVTSGYIKRLVWRKCMNTFICRTDRPFKFFGRMNEDVSTYVLNGMRGVLMWSVMYLQVTQSETQSLSGGGEPTINPDFERICQHLDELGIAYGINTNFNVAKFVRPRFLKVSIDEGLSEAYKAHRGKDALEDVLDNVRRFVTWKQSNGISTRVGLQCVTRSVEQVTQFYSAVHSLDVDYIQFRPLETKGKNIDYSSILKTIEALSQKDKRIKSSFKYGFCGWRPSECFAYWASICVDVNGNVPYCCARPSEVVGNIFDEDILAKLAAYKPDMKQCESPCRLTGANAYVMQYQNDGDRYFV